MWESTQRGRQGSHSEEEDCRPTFNAIVTRYPEKGEKPPPPPLSEETPLWAQGQLGSGSRIVREEKYVSRHFSKLPLRQKEGENIFGGGEERSAVSLKCTNGRFLTQTDVRQMSQTRWDICHLPRGDTFARVNVTVRRMLVVCILSHKMATTQITILFMGAVNGRGRRGLRGQEGR